MEQWVWSTRVAVPLPWNKAFTALMKKRGECTSKDEETVRKIAHGCEAHQGTSLRYLRRRGVRHSVQDWVLQTWGSCSETALYLQTWMCAQSGKENCPQKHNRSNLDVRYRIGCLARTIMERLEKVLKLFFLLSASLPHLKKITDPSHFMNKFFSFFKVYRLHVFHKYDLEDRQFFYII